MSTKDFTYLAIILAILAVAFFMGQRQGKKIIELQNEKYFLELRNQELEAQKDSAHALGARIAEKSRKDSLKFKFVLMSQESKIRHTDKSLAQARKEIAALADSVAPVATFINLCDSAIAQRDEAIVGLKKEVQRVNGVSTEKLQAKADEVTAAEMQAEIWRKGYGSSQKEIKKQRRGKKVWRSLAVILGISTAGLLIGSQ